MAANDESSSNSNNKTGNQNANSIIKQFLIKSNKNNKGHLANVTAKDRAIEFKAAEFYEDGGMLFCRCCNAVVEHIRRSTIVEHQQSAKHIKRKADYDQKQSINADTKKQKAITSTFKTSTETQRQRIEVS